MALATLEGLDCNLDGSLLVRNDTEDASLDTLWHDQHAFPYAPVFAVMQLIVCVLEMCHFWITQRAESFSCALNV
jgi:hypothetical protein